MATVVVPYDQIQQAFNDNPDAMHGAVDRAAARAAGGDAALKARFKAQWNEAVSALESADHGARVVGTPQDQLASRLQTMVVASAIAANKVQVVVPKATVTTDAGQSIAEATVQVKFDSGDLIGWLGTGLEILFKQPKAPFMPPPAAPEPIPDDAKIALFSDWGTGLYGAPVCADTIRKDARGYGLLLHLGDVYYSGTKKEVAERFLALWPEVPHQVCQFHYLREASKEMFEADRHLKVTLRKTLQPKILALRDQVTHAPRDAPRPHAP